MQYRAIFTVLISVGIMISSVAASGAGDELSSSSQHQHTEACKRILTPKKSTGPVDFVPSQRGSQGEGELDARYRQAIAELFGPGGIAEKLGLSLPPHRIEFMPSGQLSLLATLGRHPIAHWHDGSELATRAYQAQGVLEFVTPGCPTCRSFYSDNTSFEHQLSILMHVAGHNDVAANSMYQLVRGADPIAESLELYRLIEEAYLKYGHDQVSQFYQYLLSFVEFQDFARGTFQAPEQIQTPTSSGLQSLVAQLPVDAPQWQKDLLYRFERMNRVFGFVISTKIMNEGWATLMMEILAGHSSWTSSHHAVEYAQLLFPVAGQASLSNPYWLGREAWRALRARFNDRPEIRGLDPLERDRQFIVYAKDNFIKYRNDYDFLREALTDEWIQSHRLFLSREATKEEIDPSLPPPQDKRLTDQHIVVSTKPADIRDYIASKVADRSLQVPSISVVDFSGITPQGARGVVLLKHEVRDGIPLQRDAMMQTLYVMSQVLKKTVSLETGLEVTHKGKLNPVRVEVTPEGKASLFMATVHFPDQEADMGGSQVAELQKAVDAYRAESFDDSAIFEAQKPPAFLNSYVQALVSQQLDASIQGVTHIPTAPRALMEYATILQSRLARKLHLMLQGKLSMRVTKQGVQISVLPPIPAFRLNTKFKKAKPEDGEQKLSLMVETKTNSAAQAGDVGLGSGGRRQGDRYWAPGKPPEGEGSGEGEGDPQDGEQSPDGSGKEAGKGQGKMVTIPFDIYGKLLNEYVELPNLRPKAGVTNLVETTREGGVQKPTGDILYSRMMAKVLSLGRMSLKKQGIENPTWTDILREGMKYISESDYIVADREELPLPDVNAVVVIARDMSGSMSGDPTVKVAEFLFNLKVLLMAKYKKVTFRFVGFNDTGFEVTEEEFFTQTTSGGTEYSAGVQKSADLFEEYPEEKWDRYFFLAGDAGDGDADKTLRALEKMIETVQYTAFIQTVIPSEYLAKESLITPLKSWAAASRFFGFAKLNGAPNSGLETLRELFGKKK